MAKVLLDVRVLTQEYLGRDTNKLVVYAPQIAQQAEPGQFVNVKVSNDPMPLLRRPFGIAGVDREKGEVTLIYRKIGHGTQTLSCVKPGTTLSFIGPLGHGFTKISGKALLIGGGTGLAPLHFLAERLQDATVLMGGRTADDLVFWKKLFALPSVKSVHETTDDGSAGTHGTVMALLPQLLEKQAFDMVYVCGPTPMMKAVAEFCIERNVAVEVSLEKYMACGLGACLSCACQGIGKRLKVCKDGPVFNPKEIAEW